MAGFTDRSELLSRTHGSIHSKRVIYLFIHKKCNSWPCFKINEIILRGKASVHLAFWNLPASSVLSFLLSRDTIRPSNSGLLGWDLKHSPGLIKPNLELRESSYFWKPRRRDPCSTTSLNYLGQVFRNLPPIPGSGLVFAKKANGCRVFCSQPEVIQSHEARKVG